MRFDGNTWYVPQTEPLGAAAWQGYVACSCSRTANGPECGSSISLIGSRAAETADVVYGKLPQRRHYSWQASSAQGKDFQTSLQAAVFQEIQLLFFQRADHLSTINKAIAVCDAPVIESSASCTLRILRREASGRLNLSTRSDGSLLAPAHNASLCSCELPSHAAAFAAVQISLTPKLADAGHSLWPQWQAGSLPCLLSAQHGVRSATTSRAAASPWGKPGCRSSNSHVSYRLTGQHWLLMVTSLLGLSMLTCASKHNGAKAPHALCTGARHQA